MRAIIRPMRDQNDDILDEDPSDEDIDRFSGEEAFCPECGAQIWDSVEVCPKCFAYIGGNAIARPPVQQWMNRKMLVVIVVILLIALLAWML